MSPTASRSRARAGNSAQRLVASVSASSMVPRKMTCWVVLSRPGSWVTVT